MNKVRNAWKFLGRHKYWIVFVVGLLFVGVIDENSYLQHRRHCAEISDLRQQIDAYEAQYERDEAMIREFRQNPKAVSRVARERYFMKMDDEDIFVLSDDIEE